MVRTLHILHNPIKQTLNMKQEVEIQEDTEVWYHCNLVSNNPEIVSRFFQSTMVMTLTSNTHERIQKT
jgi:hypothetical protein